MQYDQAFIKVVFAVILGLVAFVIRGIKFDIELIKKDSISPILCLKTHELDAVKIDHLTSLIGRIEERGKTDQRETREILRELERTVDELKTTVLMVGQLRRQGDNAED